MSLHEEILIAHDGYTDTSYSTCGKFQCTASVLRILGVPGKVIEREGTGLNEYPLDSSTTVTVGLLRESDSDEWCAAGECREFLQHGLSCDCPADEFGVVKDREALSHPHPYLG